MRYVISTTALILTLGGSAAFAGDVYVDGYHRSDGTYVRPHVHSSPDNSISNNYGPSQESFGRLYPNSRDYDSDGTANAFDFDSDNDSWGDDYDSNPYGY